MKKILAPIQEYLKTHDLFGRLKKSPPSGPLHPFFETHDLWGRPRSAKPVRTELRKLLALALICLVGTIGVGFVQSNRDITFINVGSALPATCATGQAWILTSGAVGIYACTSANTWTGVAALKTVSNINNILFVDGVKYTTLAACYADIPTTGGVCEVPPNYAETLAASLTMSKSNAGFHFNGPATITMGANQLIISAGVNGAFLRATPTATYNFPTVTTGVVFSYTGTTTAFAFGTSASATLFLTLENIEVYIGSAGSAAVGITLNRVVNSTFSGIFVASAGGAITQIAYKLDGTGGFTGEDTWINPTASATKTFFQLNSNSSNNTFINGQFFTAVASSVGFDVQGGNGNVFLNQDLESLGTAFNFANSATVFDNIGNMYIAGNTTDVVFGTASFKNVLSLAGGLGAGSDPIVTDNSPLANGNSVWNPRQYQITTGGAFSVTKVSAVSPQITLGSDVALVSAGEIRRVVYKVTIVGSVNCIVGVGFIAASTVADCTIATFPAKTEVTRVIVDNTVGWTCSSVCTGTKTVQVGKTSGGTEYIVASNAVAVATYGLVNGDLGASLATSATTPVGGGDLPSFSGTTTIRARYVSGTGNWGNGATTTVNAGSTTFYIETLVFP